MANEDNHQNTSVSTPQQIGDYEIESVIQEGGMGVIYKARHLYLNKKFAVKVAKKQGNDPELMVMQAGKRFIREMQILADVNHENIISYSNASLVNENIFLVMELIDGYDLQTLIEGYSQEHHTKTFPVAAVCAVIYQAAYGLLELNEKHIVHRDIKPKNIMVDSKGKVRIIDFGIAKNISNNEEMIQHQSESALTQVNLRIGTLEYMAPEQQKNMYNADVRSDIYSLGKTLHFLLFQNEKEKTIIRNDIPNSLKNILDKMLQEEPEKRYQTPFELLDAIAISTLADEQELYDAVHSLMQKTGRLPANGTGKDTTKYQFLNRKIIKENSLKAVLGTVLCIFVLFFFVFGISPYQQKKAAEWNLTLLNIAQLPGLYGEWWGDDIPWFLPNVREMILEKIDSSPEIKKNISEHIALLNSGNVESIIAWLHQLSLQCLEEKTSDRQQLMSFIVEAVISSCRADGKEDQRICIEKAIQELEEFPAKLPADIYTLAFLYHKKYLLSQSQDDSEKAKKLYDRSKEEQQHPSLVLLLESDFGKFYENFDKIQAADKYKKILEEKERELSPLFQLELLGRWCDVLTLIKKDDEFSFQNGEYLLKEHKILQNHPLAGYVKERRAWSFINRFRSSDASKMFCDAKNIREINHFNNDTDKIQQTYSFHNQHGLAMAKRYEGKRKMAEGEYNTLVNEIRKVMPVQDYETDSDLLGRKRKYEIAINERYANANERYADCFLFGGLASFNPDNKENQGQIEKTDKMLEEAVDAYKDITRQNISKMKRGLIHLIKNKTLNNDNQNEEEINQFIPQFSNNPPTAEEESLLSFIKAIQVNNFDLANLLGNTDFHFSQSRRDVIEFRLFCAEFFLAKYKNITTLTLSQRVNASLPLYIIANSSLESFGNEMLPYIARYLDILIMEGIEIYQKASTMENEKESQKCLDRYVIKSLQQFSHSDSDQQVFVYLPKNEDQSFYFIDIKKSIPINTIPLNRKKIIDKRTKNSPIPSDIFSDDLLNIFHKKAYSYIDSEYENPIDKKEFESAIQR